MLKEIKEYEGERLKEGLWEAIQIENNMNIKNYGIKIFKILVNILQKMI